MSLRVSYIIAGNHVGKPYEKGLFLIDTSIINWSSVALKSVTMTGAIPRYKNPYADYPAANDINFTGNVIKSSLNDMLTYLNGVFKASYQMLGTFSVVLNYLYYSNEEHYLQGDNQVVIMQANDNSDFTLNDFTSGDFTE